MSNARILLIALAMAFVHSSPAAAGEYITDAQQRELAKQRLEQRQKEREQQQQERSNNSVDRSTNTYGKEWLEQQLQGDKPRVNRTW